MNKHYFFRAIWLSLVLALSACGGGSNPTNTGATTSTETFQFRTAFVNYVKETRSLPFTVTGTSSGYSVTGSGTATQGALTSASFESQAAQQKTTTVTGSMTVNGVTVPLSSSGTAYVDSNYNPLGTVGDDYAVVTNGTTIPTTAKVNDTGILYSTILYSSSTKAVKRGTETVTYALEPDTASTALLKIIVTERDANNTQSSITTITFRITTAGELTRISETYFEGTTSLTFTY
ncbi:hypothetical protein [Limnohabitans sp. Rim28]|uniref:hypothetical protein n=1 Tax=Limnohabitans sp. Rim28 TaxID=1100720 RepID=UPI001056F23D|nr:hypothetical protein [Limnohabitans sp. Rim28]